MQKIEFSIEYKGATQFAYYVVDKRNDMITVSSPKYGESSPDMMYGFPAELMATEKLKELIDTYYAHIQSKS